MGIKVNSGFSVGAPVPIDERIVLSKSQMLNMSDSTMPDTYFAICSDDGNLYVYNKSGTYSSSTGYYALVKGDGSGVSGSTEVTHSGSVFEVTLAATDWIGSTIEVISNDILSDSVVTVSLPNNPTEAELLAISTARIVGESQELGKITLKAFGDVPTIDVRVLILVENIISVAGGNRIVDSVTGDIYQFEINDSVLELKKI